MTKPTLEPRASQRVWSPMIAITPDYNANEDAPAEATYCVRMNYASALADAGALPVILPYLSDRIDELIARFDGFLISGSVPGVSTTYGRTDFELSLITAAATAGKPVLGICNGMQMIGLTLGSRLIDCLPLPGPGDIDHLPSPVPRATAHPVELSSGSRIGQLSQSTTVRVTSLHRQALEPRGRFHIAARAPDGVVEAIEGYGPGYLVGTQWHPEYQFTEFDKAVISDFVAAARGA